MSLDFHPSKEDLICSCDGDGEMRYWSINNGNCARVFTVRKDAICLFNYTYYREILTSIRLSINS